jgi:FtsP/CotA-like multicopper oxidase with cupredoxin domain
VPLVIDRIASGRDGMESWTINGERFDPERPTILSAGRRYRLALENRTSDEHPMHLHRYSFELTRMNGRPAAGVIKDVVTVPALGVVEVDVTFDRRGLALLHCHQQMHMDTGFKTLLKIV